MARIELRDCIIRLKDGLTGTAASARKTNEQQTVTLTDATGGTFTLTFDGQETSALNFDTTAGEVQSALVALSTIGAGNVQVTGTAPYLVEFIGDLAEANQPEMTASDSLTPVEATIAVATTQAGGVGCAPSAGNTTQTIGTVVLNTTDTDLVPIGARFTIAGETAPTTHVVTARTPSSSSPTTNITFTPALGAGTYQTGAVLTFASQEVEIKVGDGDVTYTEKNDYKYDLDRGDLDTVREGDQQPMDVKFSLVYEHITTGTSEDISPMDALKRKGGAAAWVSSATDKCEPYAIDVEVEHAPPCGTSQQETTLFPDFRSESREISFKDSTITVSGKCNAVEPIVGRSS
ncbi:MAG: hypothetical protein ACYC35_00575 [Pirellulales bacterium]